MGGLGEALRCVTLRGAGGEPTSAFVPPRAAGSGTPLFLAPAFGLDGRSFEPLAPLGAARRVVFWNPPNALPGGEDLAGLARFALGHAGRAGMAGRFVFGGASLGGIVALAAAIEAPERVAGLVLLGAAASWREIAWSLRAARWLHPLLPRRRYHKSFARILLPPRRASPEMQGVLDALRLQAEHRTKEYVAAVIEAVAARGGFDLRPRLAEVSCPTLVVHSAGDPCISFGAARTLAAIPGAEVVAVEGGTHLPWFPEPRAVLRPLDRFLAHVDAKEGR